MKSKWDPVEKKLRCLRSISRADLDEARRFVLASVVELYVESDEAQAQRYSVALEQEGNKEVQEMVVTWEDALASTYAEGEVKGEEKGFIEATRSHIVRVLKRRLESVPAFVRQKLDAIQSLERLEEILDQAAVVSSVDDLVLEP